MLSLSLKTRLERYLLDGYALSNAAHHRFRARTTPAAAAIRTSATRATLNPPEASGVPCGSSGLTRLPLANLFGRKQFKLVYKLEILCFVRFLSAKATGIYTDSIGHEVRVASSYGTSLAGVRLTLSKFLPPPLSLQSGVRPEVVQPVMAVRV